MRTLFARNIASHMFPGNFLISLLMGVVHLSADMKFKMWGFGSIKFQSFGL